MKVILVLVDGLRFDTAVESMGYLNKLIELGKMSLFKVHTELPSLSRPMYETILTGLPPAEHLITSNDVVRLSKEKSIFHIARQNKLSTAAAAYYWISELYNRGPFNKIEDLMQLNTSYPIQHGIYYFADEYPDSHLFIHGDYLRRTYNPDFLLVHPMGVDYMGHQHGGESKEYRGKVHEIDNILSLFINRWLWDRDTCIIITADHGMTIFGTHGGSTKEERTVPLFIIGAPLKNNRIYNGEISQLIIAPTICKLLDIRKSDKMIPETIFDI